MFPVQFFLATCLALLVLTQQGHQVDVKSLLVGSTQQSPESSQSEKTDGEKDERIQAEVAEIMAIRKQLGGGVSEQLKGFSIEMPGRQKGSVQPPEADELAIMQKVFAKRLAEQSRDHATAQPEPGDRWRITGSTQPSSDVSPRERSETLRHAARMLEEAAAMLEEAREYDQADNIRHRASELWRKARR